MTAGRGVRNGQAVGTLVQQSNTAAPAPKAAPQTLHAAASLGLPPAYLSLHLAQDSQGEREYIQHNGSVQDGVKDRAAGRLHNRRQLARSTAQRRRLCKLLQLGLHRWELWT